MCSVFDRMFSSSILYLNIDLNIDSRGILFGTSK